MISRPRRAARFGVSVLTLGVLAGCGGQASPIPAEGIDGLSIPTPTPHPGDFVSHIDNPWLPLSAGDRALYRRRPGGRVRSVVQRGPDVLGVSTTSVRSIATGRRGSRDPGHRPSTRRCSVDLYAQDRTGDVWWFGHSGPGGAHWLAGRDGAEAGVLVPARIRIGDGFRAALAPGVVDDRSTIVASAGGLRVTAGSYADVLVIDTETAVGGGSSRSYYARGVGLVETLSLTGAVGETELVRDAPATDPTGG